MSPEDLRLRRWLLRLKYSLLRRRLGSRSSRINQDVGTGTSSFPCLSLQVIVSLTTLAYICSRYQIPLTNLGGDSNTVANAIAQSLAHPSLKVGHLKAVLRQRGVSSDSILERKHLEVLAARSG